MTTVAHEVAGPSSTRTCESWVDVQAGTLLFAGLAPGSEGTSQCKSPRAHSPRSWVHLDTSWAKQLGVTRTAGRYRISRRELVRRLATVELQASSTILDLNGAPAGDFSSSAGGQIPDRTAA